VKVYLSALQGPSRRRRDRLRDRVHRARQHPRVQAAPDICYEVKIEAQSDDIETKLGKQIVLNHALQYVGSQLKEDQIGKIMRAMPRLTGRMRKSDFKFLDPQVQNNYAAKVGMHQQMQVAQAAAIQRAEQGFIPTSGYLVACDLYVSDPSDPKGVKTRRVRVNSDALSWLIKQLEAQGTMVEQLDGLPQGAQAQMADQLTAGGGQPSPAASPLAMRAPTGGATPGPRPAMGNSPMGQSNGMGSHGRMMPAGMG
jgi:hypothetical protein